MSPDPGNESTVVSSQTVCESGSRATNRRQRTMASTDNSVCEEPPDPELTMPGPSTSSTTLSVSLMQASLPTAPNPRRHRQRLASHYLNQIRQSQSSQVPGPSRTPSSMPFHHYYHPYHQHHHHHMHYPHHLHGFFTQPPSSTNPQANQSNRSQRVRSSERNPFLMVKILLFSLMTIDFVMNTIGLAVIAVMAKNHYNNLAVERSLHPPPTLDKSLPPPEDPYRNQYNHPFYGNEWTIIMPLLPSFIFVEILTLVGMFGVFCDLFSFTMTYAILKLITSLCYPSMASAAAVAAMASATGSSVASGASASHISPSLLPLPLPENFTILLNQAKLLNNLSSTTLSPFTNPADKVSQSEPEPSTTSATTTTWPDPGPTEWSSVSSSLLTTSVPNSAATTTDSSSKNYKHTRLKHDKLMANMKQLKKSEKLAKLKQREKQFRSKLMRLESAESSPGNDSTKWSPLGPASHARISLILPPSSTGSLEGASGSAHHNIKYHHRVWDALLVTFEVIFAVAFAFNTLTTSNRRTCRNEEDTYEEDEDGERRPRRVRRYRSSASRIHLPYSPLATSIDAFYFAQFQLPPPPPSYFGNNQPATVASGQRSTPQRSTSMSTSRAGSITGPVDRQQASTSRSRSLLDSRNWRRFAPSWMNTSTCQRNDNEPSTLTRSPSLRSNPPLYEEIEHDLPVVIVTDNRIEPQQPAVITSAAVPSTSLPERIVLQVINHEQSANEAAESTELTHSSVPVTPPHSPNLKTTDSLRKAKADNVTNIHIMGNDSQSELDTVSHSSVNSTNKTLVIAVNDTRV